MPSLPRRMQRKGLRQRPDYEPADQPTITLKDGGYKTLTPTKGWRTLRFARLAAQMVIARVLDRVVARKRRAQERDLYRWQKRPAPGALPPSTETRQQRRWAARHG